MHLFLFYFIFFLDYLDSFPQFKKQPGTALETRTQRSPLEPFDLTVSLEYAIVPSLAQASWLVIKINSSNINIGQGSEDSGW